MRGQRRFVLHKAELFESYSDLPEQGSRMVLPKAWPHRHSSTRQLSLMQNTTDTAILLLAAEKVSL